MKYVIVPNELENAINQKIDEFIAKYPSAEKERDAMFQDMLAAYDKHGAVPDIEPQKRGRV